MNSQLINWHLSKHPTFAENNNPTEQSAVQLTALTQKILTPTQQHFGELLITYGFTSHNLLRWIQTYSPGDMAPTLDQHASMEVNSKGNIICKREGAACDFFVCGYENRMHLVAKFIVEKLPFDRLYFYGKNSPIHISIGPENSQFVQLRHTNNAGKRVGGKRRSGIAALHFFDNLD